MLMPDTTHHPPVDPIPEPFRDNDLDPLPNSGFESELPEPDFDERI
jgi:hypothetical protein